MRQKRLVSLYTVPWWKLDDDDDDDDGSLQTGAIERLKNGVA